LITAKTILNYLPAYKADIEILTDNQDVRDIMKGMEKFHVKYANDYDKIYSFFLGATPERTAKKIFDFLKENTSYYIEGLEGQTVRNPSAILATGKKEGIDCKNFALFIGGVIDAINRSGRQKNPFAYRFAQTDQFDESYNHVFIVINPRTQKEYFIDPIPEVKNFDDRFPIYSYTDKNFSKMLYGVSGRNRVGFTVPGIGINTDDIVSAANLLNSIFSKKGSPTDYQGWAAQETQLNLTPGHSAAWWTITDGDSVQNEALNIVGWIKQYGLNSVTKYFPELNRSVTIDDVVLKLTRGGMANEAAQFKNAYTAVPTNSYTSPSTSTPNTTVVFPISQDNNGKYWDAQNKQVTKNVDGSFSVSSTQAGMNMFITLGLVGAAIFLVMKGRKK
jgi:hypothetical protein